MNRIVKRILVSLCLAQVCFLNVSARQNDKQYTIEEALSQPNDVSSILLFGDDGSTELFAQNYQKFKNLVALKVIGDDCEFLDTVVPNISSLRFVRLNMCKLEEAPAFLSQVDSMELLDLSGNNIREFPYHLALIPSLKEISFGNILFGGNPIRSIDRRIENFTNLEMLNLYQCKIETISPGLKGLHNLKYLNLSQTGLRRLPPDFGELHNLRTLYLSHTPIELFPISIYELGGLEVLGIVMPKVPHNYDDLDRLTRLRELSISVSELEEVPKGIASLDELETLSLSDSKSLNMKRTIKILRQLKSLRHVELIGASLTTKQRSRMRKQLSNLEVKIY